MISLKKKKIFFREKLALMFCRGGRCRGIDYTLITHRNIKILEGLC